MSKADRRRKRAKHAATRNVAPVERPKAVSGGSTPANTQAALCERPTEQQMRKNTFAMPAKDRNTSPVVNLTADAIGRLHVSKLITDAQEQAARSFQSLRAAYLAELPEISGYKSCLSDSVPGYDDGDGNPQVIEAYRSLERVLGIAGRRVLLRVCDRGDMPGSWEELTLLRWALGKVAGHA